MAILIPTGPVLPALCVLFVGGYIIWSIISYRRLRKIPGPKLWAVTRFPLIKIHVKGEMYEKFHELSNQYGPLVRVGPNYLVTSDTEVMRRINSPKYAYTKSNWYITARFIPGVDNMVSQRNGNVHQALRRKAAAGYSGKENKMLENYVDECILDFVHLIETKYLSDGLNKPKMELAQKVQYLTSDIGSKLGFDSKLNNVSDDRDNYGYIAEFATTFPKLYATSVMPEILYFLSDIGIMKLFDPAKSDLAFGKIFRLCQSQINARFDLNGKPKEGQDDLLGSFIRHGMTRQEVEQEAIVQMAAGSDTSATAMRATLLNIIQSDRIREKLLNEIDDAIKTYKIPSGEGEVISDAQAKELPYLQAVIKEGLRWYPPIVGMLAKEVPRGGDVLCGYRIPAGTIIGQSARAIHFSPAMYGPDQETFRPERWIHVSDGGDEPSKDKLKEMERTNELVFGSGKNQCMGKNIALLELNKIFIELMRRFEFELLDKENPWQTKCFGIHLQSGLWVNVRRRKTTL